jgi:hypothetical protein
MQKRFFLGFLFGGAALYLLVELAFRFGAI